MILTSSATIAWAVIAVAEEGKNQAIEDPRVPVAKHYIDVLNTSTERLKLAPPLGMDFGPHLKDLEKTRLLIDDSRRDSSSALVFGSEFIDVEMFEAKTHTSWAIVYSADEAGGVLIGPDVVEKSGQEWSRNKGASGVIRAWYEGCRAPSLLRVALKEILELPDDSIESLVKIATEFADDHPASDAATAEQGGADQPATAPESKPEGKGKPEPESKGRSQ